jgi:1-acyl-sn-glycerol-3-phosphate acyltransferase
MAPATSIHPQKSRGLLRNRNFVLLWCAYGISAMGDHLSELAILKTQDALSPDVDATPIDARMTFLFFLPFFMFSPIMGLLADRFPRRGLMIFADLVRCVIMVFFLSLSAWAVGRLAFLHESSWTAGLAEWVPLMPLLLVGVFAALFSPARAALLPTLIRRDQLVRANGLMAGLGIIATMIALKISGFLAHRYDAVVSFRLDALTFLISAAFLAFLVAPKLPERGRAAGTQSAATDLADGFRYVWCHRRVMELLAISALIWFCGPLVKCVIPALVRDVYGGGFPLIGTYRVYLGVGFIAGAAIISVLGEALRSEIAITWGLFGIGISIAIFAASVFLPFEQATLKAIGAVGVIGAGVFGVGVMASFNALLQRIVPDRYRGRVYGVNNVCWIAALLIATGGLGLPQWTRVDRWVGYILAAVALLAFAAGVITMTVRLGRGPLGRGMNLAENLNEFLAKFWYRLRRVGPSTVPRTGPVIITANHASTADPIFLHAAAPYRPISFLVAAEFMKLPIASFFINLLECIPVKRDGRDASATKQAIRYLRAGKAVGIFIEGRIVPPGTKPHPKDGVAMLALKTGVKVIPAHISGVVYRDGIFSGLLTRHRARVRFGRPVDLSEFAGDKSSRENVRAATRKIYNAIQALAPKDEASTTPRTDLGQQDLPPEQSE